MCAVAGFWLTRCSTVRYKTGILTHDECPHPGENHPTIVATLGCFPLMLVDYFKANSVVLIFS